ncbi:MAG: phage major capsid protein [Dehalococcoidales bacterium]|nr:phage major capsid protein [Dehalococcoidales bacterium]
MATIGSTAAPSTNTVYYDSLLSTTMMAFRDTLVDNIFKDSAYLAFLRNSDAVKKQNGGERIAMPLMYGTNSTIKSYQGEEVIDTTLQDGITTAFYEWKEIAGTIGITRKEERQNSGEGRLLDLLKAKLKQAEMGMREELNRQLVAGTVSGATFVPGNNGKDLNPLGYFMRKNNQLNPTAGGNVGNISAVTDSWWRPQTAVLDSASVDTGNAFAISVSTYQGFKAALYRMYNSCSKGSGGSPNLVVFDQISFETYNNALDVSVRYMDTKMAEMGFDTIKMRGATCIWDEQVPDIDNGTLALTAGSAFFINTNFYNLVIDSETDIITTPFVEPENQTVKTAKILFMGNAAVSNLRKHGVVYAVSRTIVA